MNRIDADYFLCRLLKEKLKYVLLLNVFKTIYITALCPLHPEYSTPYLRKLRQILGMGHPASCMQCLKHELAAYCSCSCILCRERVSE